ncbi:hypothetical protein ACOXXX_20340 [Thalassococcus sp. BH17M4-6]|uniref:hypothetical protein n=1 Tax=Thalassococcus sp. BH17M4-6 TaxID=3413148 RepID=UPI003BCEC2C7
MDDALRKFEERHRAVTKRHRQLARGYVTKLGRNGVIEHRPRRQTPKLSLPMVLMLGSGFLAFKSFLFVSLGAEAYGVRVDTLANGTVVERVGGWLMQADPATQWISANLVPLLG